ncbi:MAG: nucleoside deaminase [Acetobacterales bacterium]
MPDGDDVWMQEALDEARTALAEGNFAVGSVIVRAGTVIGRGRNRVNERHDPILHAETVAIQDACARLGSEDLSGTTLYTTMEPCPMCCWAIWLAGIRRLVVGARHADFSNPRSGGYAVEKLLAMTGQSMELTAGIRAGECLALRMASEG